LAIGQSYLLITPLQMACIAATFANGGTGLHPYVVKRIEAAEGQVVHEGQPEIRGHLSAKPQQIEFVRRAMLGAVQEIGGTAHLAAVSGLTVAGKTGTAEYDVTVDGKPQRLKHAWFMGFAPYEQPQVALAVLIEDASSGGHTAGPVAQKVFSKMFGKGVVETPGAESGTYAD
jgi:cell division protein FtsI/penicillin-binding protein 2